MAVAQERGRRSFFWDDARLAAALWMAMMR